MESWRAGSSASAMNVPSKQSEHTVPRVAVNLPAAQVMHPEESTAPESELVPTGQSEQSSPDDDPTDVPYFPASHELQIVAPESENLPAKQAVQSSAES